MRERLPGAGGWTVPATGIIDAGTAALRSQAVLQRAGRLARGLVHSWNVAYQRELPGRWSAEVAYVGNRGHDIIATTEPGMPA